eukprot:gene1261-32609_t
MRKDNYLIAIVNAGLLKLAMPSLFRSSGESCSGGSSKKVAKQQQMTKTLEWNLRCKKVAKQQQMTKTLEWNLRWCVLDPMFDETFCLKRGMCSDVERLKRRLRGAAVVKALLSPSVLLFFLIYF